MTCECPKKPHLKGCRWARPGRPPGLTSLNREHYDRWKAMMARCYKPNHPFFPDYGGRGIDVHPSFHSFEDFLKYLITELGPRPRGTSLDRVDNDQGYRPGNLRWASASVQLSNRRTNSGMGENLPRSIPG